MVYLEFILFNIQILLVLIRGLSWKKSKENLGKMTNGKNKKVKEKEK